MKTTPPFERLAGLAAIAAALVGLLYSVAFVVLRNAGLSAACLMAGGLLSLVALVALFERLGAVEAQAARLGILLGASGAMGAVIHGAYDLSNVINPPGALPESVANLPNPIDPRGLLTFGVAGLSLVVAGLLLRRQHTAPQAAPARFPGWFAGLTLVLAALLIVVYLGRLIVLSPASPLVLGPAALTGFIVNPLWYLLLGLHLRRETVRMAGSVHNVA